MKDLVAKAIEGADGKGFNDFYHDGGPKDVDSPEPIEEMLGPFFDHPAKGQEVEDGGVDIDYSEGGLKVVEEMVYLLYDIILQFLTDV